MRRPRGRKGNGGAGMLLIIIGVMILFYLLFLPTAERTRLLEGESAQRRAGPGQGPPTNILLSKNVGTVNPPSPNEVEHTLPSFTIFTKTNAMEMQRKPTLIAKNGLFTNDQSPTLSFQYDSSKMKNVMLSFNAKKTGGRLIIRLNGEEIFNSELESGSPPPIKLPASLLQSQNTLTFEASSPGLAVWSINVHDLRNVIVSAEVTDRSGSAADQHFSIPEQEYDAMSMAELKFLPNCDPESAGRLRISVNRQEVFSGFADCGVPNKIEVAKEMLNEGDNTVRFISEKGQYLVDMAKVTSKIEGQGTPVFYFNLPPYLYDRIYLNDALLFVTLRFADQRSMKTGVLNINGFETSFRTQDLTFQTQVNPEFLTQGPNSVMIIPQGQPLEIVELRVETS